MEIQKQLRMKEGVGQDSYANNSSIQRSVTMRAKSVVEESVKEVYHALKPKCFMMADMGCSSGPNALLVATETINAIDEACRSLNLQAPEFGIFLSDLPRNDFNTLFNFLPDFYKWLEQEKGSDFGPCFVSGTPRSFHGRVFPADFLHFIYSGCALNYLSQVPEGLVTDQGEALNKGNVWITKASPSEVHKAYYDQFKKDFTMFLSSRAVEVVRGGSMVLTLGADKDQYIYIGFELLSSALRDMVLEGKIEEEKLDKFNMPIYSVSTAEDVSQLVDEEGSFNLNKLVNITVSSNIHTTEDPDTQAEARAKSMRAVTESLLANAFGEAIIDDLYFRFKNKTLEHLAVAQPQCLSFFVVSLTKKT